MQAYLVSGDHHGRVAQLNYSDPIRSGRVPPRILVGGDQEEYVLSAYTGDNENDGEADLFYTPSDLTTADRNAAISAFIRDTPPWKAQELSAELIRF